MTKGNGKDHDNELTSLMKVNGDGSGELSGTLTVDKEMAKFVVAVTMALDALSQHQQHHCEQIALLIKAVEDLKNGAAEKELMPFGGKPII